MTDKAPGQVAAEAYERALWGSGHDPDVWGKLGDAERIAWAAVEQSARDASRPPVVCLCGSTRFVDAFNSQRKSLTEQGEIVLSIEIVTTQAREQDPQHADPELKARLDVLHRRKIDLADRVLVVSDESGYFGSSTSGEIAYAVEHGKPVSFQHAAAGRRAVEAGLVTHAVTESPERAQDGTNTGDATRGRPTRFDDPAEALSGPRGQEAKS